MAFTIPKKKIGRRRRRGFLCLAEAGATFSISMIVMFLLFFRMTAIFHINELTLLDRNGPYLQSLSWSTIEQTPTVIKLTGGTCQLCDTKKIRFYDAIAVAALKGDTSVDICGNAVDLKSVAYDKIMGNPVLSEITDGCAEYVLRNYKGDPLIYFPSTPDPKRFDTCVKYFVHEKLRLISKDSTTWLVPLPLSADGTPQLTEQVLSTVTGAPCHTNMAIALSYKDCLDLYVNTCPKDTTYESHPIDYSDAEGNACDCDGAFCKNGKYCVYVPTGYSFRECTTKGLTPPPDTMDNCTGVPKGKNQISNDGIPDPQVKNEAIKTDCNCGDIACKTGLYCCRYKQTAIYVYRCQELPCI